MRNNRPILALISSHSLETREIFQPPDAVELPGFRITWLLVQEVSISFDLVMIQFRNELHVHARAGVCASHSLLVSALGEVQMLPR